VLSGLLSHPFFLGSFALQHLSGQCGLFFTNSGKKEVVQWFDSYQKPDYPKTGFVATKTYSMSVLLSVLFGAFSLLWTRMLLRHPLCVSAEFGAS
jgi:hypothetical protein